MNFLLNDLTSAAGLAFPEVEEQDWVMLNSARATEDQPVAAYRIVGFITRGGPAFRSFRPAAPSPPQHYRQRLTQVLDHSSVALPAIAATTSQHLLEAILEFRPHQIGMSIVVDEEEEASLVLTAYWPSNTLHVEHFYHFPADEPADTVVNLYDMPTSPTQVPAWQCGWHGLAPAFGLWLRGHLRSGQWPLAGGW